MKLITILAIVLPLLSSAAPVPNPKIAIGKGSDLGKAIGDSLASKGIPGANGYVNPPAPPPKKPVPSQKAAVTTTKGAYDWKGI
ncbi:hypothetical protein BCR33DRAFT_716596, partial [Rhizoclosmatium globosum]